MKITITGSLGNISQKLVERLAAAGNDITVISHTEERVPAIEQAGARAAIGSLEDQDFLIRSFEHADAVYTMIPPNYVTTDLRGYMRATGERYAEAIRRSSVKHVVNLSSVGAHLPEGPGPTGTNYYIEQKLNELPGVHVLHLRPGMFYTNFYGAIPMMRHQGIVGHNFDGTVKMVLTHPHDIAAAAFEALHALSFTGKAIQYVASDERNGNEVAAALGNAIGKTLSWVAFPDEAMLQGMLQNGLTEQMATIYVLEIGKALRDGVLFGDYEKNRSLATGSITLNDFAQEFAHAFNK